MAALAHATPVRAWHSLHAQKHAAHSHARAQNLEHPTLWRLRAHGRHLCKCADACFTRGRNELSLIHI
eukprot:4834177-Alexandrium_andersonii.AAC.2